MASFADRGLPIAVACLAQSLHQKQLSAISVRQTSFPLDPASANFKNGTPPNSLALCQATPLVIEPGTLHRSGRWDEPGKPSEMIEMGHSAAERALE